MAVIIALILANGVLAGAEIAVISFRKTRLNELVSAGRRRARAVQRLRENPERFLATVQIGITVIGATAGAFGGAAVAGALAELLRAVGLSRHAEPIALAIVVVTISYLSVVLGELVPKSLALRHAERYSLWIGPLFVALSSLMRPFVWILTASSNLVLRLFGDSTTFTEARLSRDELQQLVEEAAQAGAIDAPTSEIASRAFDFGDLQVAAVMVPRESMVALPRTVTPDELRRRLLESGHSRLPLYDGTIDNIIGYVIAKDVLAVALEQPLIVLDDIRRPAHFVPETMRAVDLLRELQRRQLQLAIVVDERGTVSGLVTMEDLLEELVGDILSEHEQPVALVEREPGGSARVQAIAPVHEVNRALDLTLPESPSYATVAGLCLALAGEIPAVGARLASPDGSVLEILEATPRRVRVVRVHPPPRANDEG